MLNEACDDCGLRFDELRKFVGGLAATVAYTSSVESYFSIGNWEFSSDRILLSNLCLGGIMHAKQHNYLKNV